MIKNIFKIKNFTRETISPYTDGWGDGDGDGSTGGGGVENGDWSWTIPEKKSIS